MKITTMIAAIRLIDHSLGESVGISDPNAGVAVFGEAVAGAINVSFEDGSSRTSVMDSGYNAGFAAAEAPSDFACSGAYPRGFCGGVCRGGTISISTSSVVRCTNGFGGASTFSSCGIGVGGVPFEGTSPKTSITSSDK
jgi:hypothetical protein